MQAVDPMPRDVTDNLALIGALESRARNGRRVAERISDAITRMTGSLTFVLLHVTLIAGWFIVNAGLLPGVKPFDPFPFGILTLFVSTEGVFLAIFILISQNRMTRDADRRANLELQLSLITEQSSTKTLQLLQAVAEHLELPVCEDPELSRLARRTDVNKLLDELERALPRE